MSIQEYKQAVARTGTAQLTLVNDEGDSAFIGNATTMVRFNDSKIRFRWTVKEHDWYKYTHALLHVGDKVYQAYEIGDLIIAPDTGKIELICPDI